ncbi:MAG TPA: hypothetical protein VF483_13105 [Gemmatimonadaceae bacterium]
MIFQDSAKAPLSERLQNSFGDVFGDLLPKMLLALGAIAVGFVVAKLIERLVDGLLRKIGLNKMLDRGGVLQAMERSGARVNPTRVLSKLVFWMVMFAVVLAAANWLGLSSVAAVIGNLVTYIPSVITAIVIVVVGILLGQFVNGLIGASIGGLHGGRALARAGQAGVVIIATFMALQELGIASDIVTTAFAILFGAIALALALAFGLGNRDLAGEITRAWYEQYSRERRESAARLAAEEEEDAMPPGGDGTPR